MRKSGTRLLLALLLSACSGGGSEAGGGTGGASTAVADSTPINIVLVTIDTLRADRLSCYGGPAGLTPALDRLASEGVLFEQAITPAPITLPAHASLFTGTVPATHGVRDNSGFVLGSSHQTLAEELSRAGYQTGAFVGAFVLDSRFGLDQGFDTYFDDFPPAPLTGPQLGISERTAEEVVQEAEAWIRARSRQRPWFAWIHLFDPHAPYQPPPSFRQRGDYEGEIAFADAQLSRLFRFLQQQGQYEHTLVVVTADHGEGLGEHGEDTHGMFLYDSTLHVPLIVRPPGGIAGGRRATPQVGLIDIMPTVLGEAGLAPPDAVQGRSLQAAWNGGELTAAPAYAETLLPLLNYGWSHLTALRTDSRKWIEAPQAELYALQQDPEELTNIRTRDENLARNLSAELKTMMEGFASTSAAGSLRQPDAETRQRLQSLGYAASSHPARATPSDWVESLLRSGNRPDPKQKIELFNQIWRAQGQAQQGNYREAVGLLDRVLAQDPQIFMAHSIRALSLLELGQPKKAMDSLQEAAKLRPEDPGAHLYLGLAQQRLGRVDEAIESFQEAWLLDPQLIPARNNLAAMLGQKQRYVEAAKIFESMVQEEPEDLAARLNLGGAYLMQERLEDARRQLLFVEQRQPQIPELQNNLGLLYLRTGELQAAERHLQEALRLRPEYASAHRNLAEVYRRLGRLEESSRHLRAAQGQGVH